MPLLGNLLKKGIKIRESLEQQYSSPFDLQKNELRKLLIAASSTAFGRHYGFKDILETFKNPDPKYFYKIYKNRLPLADYNKMFSEWWYRDLRGEANVCWPGKVKYFALSSGTSEASSKHIPVTKEMSKAIQKTSIRQILSLSHYDLPPELFQTGILMLGGSTDLQTNGRCFEGDLSGIQTAQLPFWFQHFYKPGKKISKYRNWDEKLNEITRKAKDWDIGIIVGVPAWIQILMEKIIDHYGVRNIHEIWPNLQVYVHGGVAFDPYRKSFGKLLDKDKPFQYIETYLSSEGFIAFQAKPDTQSMKLVLNNGIFYEFVPFEEQYFNGNGELHPDAATYMIDEVEENKDYALILSTCAGAWRYTIGDVIRFTSVEDAEIVITGRTKHYLSLCGEHLSVDNMNKAVKMLEEQFNIEIPEFTVAGEHHGTLFAHHWYIGIDKQADPEKVREQLDANLKDLNDDYAVERGAALKEVFVEALPTSYFYDFLKEKGKVGGQNKFPRVMKGRMLDEWKDFLARQQ